MSLELKQHLRMSQQLVMTPQLQQAIKLLQLSRLELESLIREEIEQNPLLEEPTSTIDQDRAESAEELTSIERFVEQERAAPEPPENRSEEVKGADGQNEIDWENYLNSYQLTPTTASNKGMSEDLPPFEANLTREETLFEHLVAQMRLADFAEEEETVALLILGNLDDFGYFRIEDFEGDPLIAVAAEAGASLAVAASALGKLQKLEPLGVCARDLQECLLIQARAWGEEGTLVGVIIRRFLKALESKNLEAIVKEWAKETKAEKDDVREDVIEAVKTIAEMDPRPARHFVSEEAQYITPDVYVHKVGDEYMVVVNDDGLSKLRISHHYRDALRNGDAKANGSKEFIQEKLRSALWLIRSIHQRQRTIHKVTESIVKFQRDFLDHGVSQLKPLILKDVAEDIQMHESTVSRVTTNKYVHTPQGIFELKWFFNSAIAKSGGDEVASEAVKAAIKRIVASETTPHSDQKLVELLRLEKIVIARRTVAKYREEIGILPSSKRRKIY
ncbi:RNA polymerase factor sigma-54 [Vulgatibacter incomptus]|uniref:RNA polymerase sigma-54 factor RpoN n=1 Tax=Vulgatibacter incomptus TaxID=1391653 RepID=A0A0K1PFD2_9BACT|nr:RNA polymerase factor sigma-54 [Vulgatibacter incomptus]AKU92233.1 RNA polymerase sigma-54 factor RpoN [Vulgatibacter incomptus]